MKKILVVILAAFCFQVYAEQTLLEKPRVDKRVELLSIVFRLAGKPEYNSDLFTLYTDRIDNYFAPYKDHELIKFTRSVMNEEGLAYDAVMSMALNLDEKLNLLTDTKENALDSRWSRKNAENFIRLLKKFHEETGFDTFYRDNSDLYQETSKRFSPVYEQLDLKWFDSFYGKGSRDRFIIINALGNGGNNYGLSLTRKDGSRSVYAVMGTWLTDNAGMPDFRPEAYFPILIHEFNHSFVNAMNEKYYTSLEKNAKRIFEIKQETMTKQAYGDWRIMLNEALVRAAVLKYMKDHNFGNDVLSREVSNEESRGFIWVIDLVKELDRYDKQRDIYPSLEDYMPRLVEAYQRFADFVEQTEIKAPAVASIKEFVNGDMAVDAGIGTITINYDKPLTGGNNFSVFYGSKGQGAFPRVQKIYYANDNKSVVMEVVLEKGKEYQFVMKGDAFRSPEGFRAKDYQVDFKTGN